MRTRRKRSGGPEAWTVAALLSAAPLAAETTVQDPHAGIPAPASPPAAAAADRPLSESDMAVMAGMSREDPMAGMSMPGWQWMGMGSAAAGFNDQGGPSGEESFESTNWVMVHGAARPRGPGG